MKTASWCLALLLAGFLVYAFALVPPPGEPNAALSIHVTSRYQQRAEAETGIHSQTGAVLADYRSFDLLALSLLFSACACSVLFCFTHLPKFFSIFPALLWLGLGALFTLGMGFLCLQQGSNFLDYEALARWFNPPQARLEGALVLMGGSLLSLGGMLALFIRWIRTPEGSGGR